MQNESIKIDVVSDVARPWCYIGIGSFAKTFDIWKSTSVGIEWHPFQFDPNIPEDGLDRDTCLKNRSGSLTHPL